MNRFFVQPQDIKGKKVQFPPALGHQILHVLRLRTGDLVDVLDNSGRVYRTELDIDTASKNVRGRILDSSPAKGEPIVQIELCVGLSHREKVEWMLQKGTEVGVSVFRPFVSSRTLVQSREMKPKRRDRWESIIREAAEQSGRGKLPRLEAPMLLKALMEDEEPDETLSLLAWEEADLETSDLSEVLERFSGSRIRLFVGPEGGFSEEEVQASRTSGCQVVSLGNRILRMETAAILFPGLILYLIENPVQIEQ
jgi:16S rRNA (uracil1498-N3)-methyltransferase